MLVVGTNSYISVADADIYFADSLYNSNWTEATDADKASALVSATRIIDFTYTFNGSKTDDDQTLAWPRSEAYDCEGVLYDDDEIPQSVQDATCEQAVYLLISDPSQIPSITTAGFSEAKLDVMSIKIDKNNVADMLARSVRLLLDCVGETSPIPGLGFFRNGNVTRA